MEAADKTLATSTCHRAVPVHPRTGLNTTEGGWLLC
jgi:hypothetical protein